MSDSLTDYTLSYSVIGIVGPWADISESPLPPEAQSADDNTPPNPVLWYKLSQTTANGQSVPYPVVSLSTLPMGELKGTIDPNDPTRVIFVWNVPNGLPAPIGHFELSGKFQNDPEFEWCRYDAYGPNERTGIAPVVRTDDVNNPYTYRLIGFIPR